MTLLWINDASDRLPAMGFRTRIVACAATAAAIPLALLAANRGTPAMILAGAALGALWFVLCVFRLLLPIRDAARAIEACAEGEPMPDMAVQQDDEIGTIAANVRRIADRLGTSAVMPERAALERDLRRAIDRDEFVLHYQPVVDLGTGRLAGAEALVRWSHPDRGLIPPMDFVPVLEETGMMAEAGRWIFDAACKQARVWEEMGLKDFKLAVNLSASRLKDPTLKTTILRTMDLHRMQPERLEVELTETAAIYDIKQTRVLFAELRALGVTIAIDDFGSGYSSLSHVKNLPFNKLKIDREFITDVDRRADSQAICRALIELARGLSITVQAEGVETREEVETLRNLGCTMFQGFYFARPLTPEVFATTVRDPNWLALLASPVHRELAGLQSRIG
jgi:EAL domain-containing protein (putative c-di-GMP-specific phosphodiesterase class I)/HAMP domain-containing protein